MVSCTPKTPTFQGSRYERFETAVRHYQEKMGIDERVYVGTSDRFPDYCAWTQRVAGYPGAVVVAFNQGNPHCIGWKPEELALHEACHIRMKHNEPLLESMDRDEKEREARKCTYWYEEGVR